ncbi:VIT1/CCC1 transporter family protein [Microbaculum sp. FT89]|uniref:VIT1/CCC1 transporter family protein n=1 Tax=Microbaculum sp. FT89 TaxID=3447298 RepID=UPI003F5293BB
MGDMSIRERWRAEKTAAFLSRAVAEAEPDPAKQALFRSMADAAERQAAILAAEAGGGATYHPPLRARVVAAIARRVGPRAARPILAASKVRGISVYAGPATEAGHAMPTSVEQIGGRHKGAGGGALRAAVFGVNDGLVSNTSLVMGVAGAALDPGAIVLTGVAGLLAGAFSMAAGEYISMRSQREMFEYQIAQERDELERYPDEEAEELALIYNARGIPMDEARTLGRRLVADPDVALDTLAREELGLNPDDLGSPWGAALWSFLAFAAGAILPLLPFFAGFGTEAIPMAAGLAAVALFGVGAALSLFSGRGALAGGLRMVTIGALAGAATYAIGTLFGVAAG